MTQLIEIQKWFGKALSVPLDSPLSTEAKAYLKPVKGLEIYHKQYWWRLLKCLQENFPLLTRLYGYEAFNHKIGVPYLSQHPPDHWALCQLGQSLPQWCDHDLDRDSALIDAASQKAFWIKSYNPIDFSVLSSDEILSKKLTLQPHVHLFELGGDLFSFRERLLQEEVSYWQTHPLPEIREGRSYFVLYRNPKNHVKWKELKREEHILLSLFQNGSTIQEACDRLAGLEGDEWELLPLWFREWTFLKWFREV